MHSGNPINDLDAKISEFKKEYETRNPPLAWPIKCEEENTRVSTLVWSDLSPPSALVDSWATRVGTLSVLSALFAIGKGNGDDIIGDSQVMLRILGFIVLLFCLVPLWNYCALVKEVGNNKNNYGLLRDDIKVGAAYAIVFLMAVGPFLLFWPGFQVLINFMLSPLGRLLTVSLIPLGIIFALLLGRLQRKRSRTRANVR
ncbi:hypothetical protein SAMN05444149_107137 [Pseudosulfitobacter pseudonitzschiae]|nr:hypothetical protein SAMN05444149_107137 [Pseudosulfitobacter pseudonitzschiae]